MNVAVQEEQGGRILGVQGLTFFYLLANHRARNSDRRRQDHFSGLYPAFIVPQTVSRGVLLHWNEFRRMI